MGLREQSIVGCFTELCFSVFRGACACGVAKAILNNFVLPTRASTAGFNNNNVTHHQYPAGQGMFTSPLINIPLGRGCSHVHSSTSLWAGHVHKSTHQYPAGQGMFTCPLINIPLGRGCSQVHPSTSRWAGDVYKSTHQHPAWQGMFTCPPINLQLGGATTLQLLIIAEESACI